MIGTCDPRVVYRTRVGYHSFDMEPNVDFMRYRDTAGTELGSDTGAKGWAWSGWMTPAPADRKVNLVLQSNATNQSVVNTQWCEYRASDAAVASPFWIPLRFPGQYWDRESDYFENWNRCYDPWTGRYMQPEPLMLVPDRIMQGAERARVASSYSYALDGPTGYSDSDGLDPRSTYARSRDEFIDRCMKYKSEDKCNCCVDAAMDYGICVAAKVRPSFMCETDAWKAADACSSRCDPFRCVLER